MARYSRSRFLPILLILIIVVIAIFAIVSLTRAIFFRDTTTDIELLDTSRDTLLTTNAGNSVRMTIRGDIVADEAFHSYQITISPSSRTLVTYRGYLDKVVDRVSLPNNTAAYTQFVYALDKANYTKGDAFEGDADDTRGICATGELFEFETREGSNTIKRLWTSSCKGSPGSLQASSKQLQNLFESQIPDADEVISNVGF